MVEQIICLEAFSEIQVGGKIDFLLIYFRVSQTQSNTGVIILASTTDMLNLHKFNCFFI